MEKVGAYKIISDRKLVVEYYSGIINTADVIYFKSIIRKDPNYDFYFNTIIDLRDCNLQIALKDFDEMIEIGLQMFKKGGTRNVAYLTCKPNEVVLVKLYSDLAAQSELGYNPMIFSTVQATVNWIGNNIVSIVELETIIKDLKTKPNNVYTK